MPTPAQKILWELMPLFRRDSFNAARELLAYHISSPENWQELLHESGRHRLLGYLVQTVRGATNLPSFAVDQARRTFDGMRVRYGYQCIGISWIKEALGDTPHLFSKGVVVALGAHSLPYLRTSGDIDLLIPTSHLLWSVERLTAHGFQLLPHQHFPWPPPAWLHEASPFFEIDEVTLHRAETVTEIHPELVSKKLPHAIEMQELLAEKRFISLPDMSEKIPTPSIEDIWLHLLLSHALHRFAGGLGILLDVARWEDRYLLSMQKIHEKIERWRIAYLVHPVLVHLKKLFPDLPSVQGVDDHAGEKLDLFELAEKGRSISRTPWYWIRKSPHPVRATWHNLFPSRITSALRYGRSPSDPRLWWARVTRPLKLLHRHQGTIRQELKR